MLWKRISILLAFFAHLLIGGACFIENSYAAESTEPSSTLMSKQDDTQCPWVQAGMPSKPGEESPCASGHCLSKSGPAPSCLSLLVQEQETSAFPLTEQDVFLAVNYFDLSSPVPERPPPLTGVETIVLLR